MRKDHHSFFVNTILYPACGGLTVCSFLSMWYFALAIPNAEDPTRTSIYDEPDESDQPHAASVNMRASPPFRARVSSV